MLPDTTILSFDTSAAQCAVALFKGEQVLDARHEEMTRGQAERLIPMIEEMLAEQGLAWSDLDLIGVGTGPGNFTGIRISVSAARGLGLSLTIPVIGVSVFDALRLDHSGPITLAAPRGFAYLQTEQTTAPAMIPPEQATARDLTAFPVDIAPRIARVAFNHKAVPARPKPLYIRPPDAAPARDTGPRIL